MNNATLIGRFTKDPIVRKVPVKGVETSVCNFTIAADDGFGDTNKTEFFHVTAWRKAAEAIGAYMTKGREIAVIGAVHLENYKVKNEAGAEETRWCVAVPRASYFEFLGKRVVQDDPDQPPFEEGADA